VGVEALGERDGRVALYLADHLPRLLAPTVRQTADTASTRETAILDALRSKGASFFGPLHETVGGGYPGETVDAIWDLVWQGLVTNDTFHALRAFTRAHTPRRKAKARQSDVSSFRSRRLAPPSAEGRWTVLPAADRSERSAKAVARQ